MSDALVLSGGGVRGAYQEGFICAPLSTDATAFGDQRAIDHMFSLGERAAQTGFTPCV